MKEIQAVFADLHVSVVMKDIVKRNNVRDNSCCTYMLQSFIAKCFDSLGILSYNSFRRVDDDKKNRVS